MLFKEIQYVQSPFFQHEKTEFPVTKTLQQQQELLVKDSLLFSLFRHDPCLKDLHGVFCLIKPTIFWVFWILAALKILVDYKIKYIKKLDIDIDMIFQSRKLAKNPEHFNIFMKSVYQPTHANAMEKDLETSHIKIFRANTFSVFTRELVILFSVVSAKTRCGNICLKIICHQLGNICGAITFAASVASSFFNIRGLYVMLICYAANRT